MRTVVTIALLIALWVCVIGHGAGASATTVPSEVINNSDEVIAIQLQPDGNARFSVIRKISIEDTNSRSSFEKNAKQWESVGVFNKEGEPSTRFLTSIKRAAERVSNESNRSMKIDNIENTTATRNDSGLFYRNFTWTNFAAPPKEGSPASLKQSFSLGDGTWLPVLGDNQTLVISYPDGYELTGGGSISSVGNNYHQYDGPKLLETNQEFDITYQKEEYTDPPDSNNDLRRALIGVVALVAVGSVGAFVFSRRRTLVERVTVDGELALWGWTSTEAASEDEPLEPDVEEIGPEDGSVTDVELLSDEERVERLLRRNGGRMRQAAIVIETDWSDAKVSQLLSAMDEAERIEKLRIGRENLISLPDYEISADADSGTGSDRDHA